MYINAYFYPVFSKSKKRDFMRGISPPPFTCSYFTVAAQQFKVKTKSLASVLQPLPQVLSFTYMNSPY